MTEKKPATKSTPQHVVRRGEIAATINMKQSNAGYAYWDYSLTRCWTSRSTGKESHGSSFFDQHEEDLIDVIREASEWIRNKVRSNSEPGDAANLTTTP